MRYGLVILAACLALPGPGCAPLDESGDAASTEAPIMTRAGLIGTYAAPPESQPAEAQDDGEADPDPAATTQDPYGAP